VSTVTPPRILAGTGISTTPLGLGCATIYRQPNAKRRRHLLDAAFDAGIRHFDVAPMYGLGIAERELGRFARGRRDEVVIATKFGIAPTRTARAIGRVQGPARRLLAASPGLNSRARSTAAGPGSSPAGSMLYEATGFDAASARAGLERSLRELKTDYIDLLLLHDPEPGRVRGDEVCESLEEARTAGRIRTWGVAGEPVRSVEVARGLAMAPPVLQVRDDILERAVPSELPAAAVITFGVLGGGVPAILAHVTETAARRRAWQEAVGADCGDPMVVSGLLLRWAVRSNPDGVVLFGSTRSDHIVSGAAATAGGPGDLDRFLRLIDLELRAASEARADV
jgi:D-threo-aldose 1-dehydrogenase